MSKLISSILIWTNNKKMHESVRKFLYILLLSRLIFASGSVSVPKLNGVCYVKPGDLNIGLLVSLSGRGEGQYCASDLASRWRPQYVEAFKFAIEEINRNEDILQNVTLGYIVMDTCGVDLVSLARSMYFIPDGNSTTRPVNSEPYVDDCSNTVQYYDVVGLVGPGGSQHATMVASLMTLFQIPVLGTFTSSDELTDESRFEYFMRLVPPDRFQAQAIMDFIQYHNWTYVSLLYTEGVYGENGARQIERETKLRQVCIAYTHKFTEFDDDDIYETVVKKLVQVSEARAVILFIKQSDMRKLVRVIETEGLTDYFVLVASDSLTSSDFGRGAHGFFSLSFTLGMHPDFREYFRYLTPQNSSGNPWFKPLWEKYNDCKWNMSYGNQSCFQRDDIPNPDFSVTDWASKFYDGALTYGYALDSLIKSRCPSASTDSTKLKNCVNGKSLLPFMKNVTFTGMSGKIKFNEAGDMIGEYNLYQYIYNNGTHRHQRVGSWDKDTESLDLDNDKIQYDFYRRNVLSSALMSRKEIPESVCSKPCKRKQYQVQIDVICCWECRTCRNNEFIVNESTCETCPATTWPDNYNATKCLPIEPSYMKSSDTIAIGLILLTCVLLVCVGVIIIVLIKNKDVKLIKASGRELSGIIMIGIILAYATVFVFIAKPSTASCNISHLGFNLTVSIIYIPLLLKTNRVYRIFASGKQGVKALKWIGSTSQLLLCALIFIIQIVLSVLTTILLPPVAKFRMQIPTEKHVELFCDLPLEGLLIPLAYNLALIILCALYGFLTRKLPENFNESWYIFISVSTTAFLWVVFLPTYFSTFYAYHQAALLAFCLILNASVTLLCLYVPKIYAIYFVNEDEIKFMNTQVTTSTTTGSNQVAPIS